MKLSFGVEGYVGSYHFSIPELSRNTRSKKNKILINFSKNRFWLFVYNCFSKDNDIMSLDYNYVHLIQYLGRCNYIDKTDYERIKNVLYEKIEISERMVKKDKEEKDLSHLIKYIDEFALIIAYAKDYCFTEWDRHCFKIEQVLNNKKRKDVLNFFADMTEGIDIKNIIIEPNGRDKITIDTPILMKMMLYSFAREYYTFIEGVDEEQWEDALRCTIKDTKSGSKKHTHWLNIKALINVYFNFMCSEGIFNEKTSIRDKCLAIGRLLTIAGLDKYDIRKNKQVSYIDEKDFYRLKISRFIEK